MRIELRVSEIEGKVARVATSEMGSERVSIFKPKIDTHEHEFSGVFDWFAPTQLTFQASHLIFNVLIESAR